jgi:hypothetical protein
LVFFFLSLFICLFFFWQYWDLNLLGKTLHKENSGENSRPRAGFNGSYEVVQEEEKRGWFRPGMAFYRRGRVRGWCMRQGP